MTTTPESPAAAVDASDPAWETARVDAALTAQAMSAAVFLAGLIANGQLETVGRPDKLPQDLWPHVPPEVAEEIFQRGLAVGLHAGQVSRDARLYRDQMDRVRGELEAAGFHAMGRAVARSRRLVAPEFRHPADGEDGRGHATAV